MEQVLGLRPESLEEREVAVLNSLIRHPQLSDHLLAIVKAEDFYYAHHGDIFAAIAGLFEKNVAVDMAAVAGEMESRRTLQNLGDRPHLAIHRIWDYSTTAFGAATHAKIVHETALLRTLARVAERIHEDATDPAGSCDEVLANAERAIFEIAEHGVSGQVVSLGKACSEAISRLDQRITGTNTTDVLSGFRDLDEMTAGFHNSELALIAARTSVGKTIFGLNIALKAAERGEGVFFASLEQSYIELAERALSREGNVDSHRIRSPEFLTKAETDILYHANTRLAQHNFWIDHQASQTLTRISANCRRLKRQYGIRLVVVDYLQLIQAANPKVPRQEQVADVSRRLKALARDLNLPVIALTQVNRSSEDRTNQRPRLSDLRESGALEQDADVVLILHRLPVEQGQSQDVAMIGIDVAKQRNGRTGELKLAFRKSTMRFENYQEQLLP